MKAEIGWKLGLYDCQIMTEKEKFSEESEKATAVNTWTVIKWKSITADMEKATVVWTELQISYNILLNQSLI